MFQQQVNPAKQHVLQEPIKSQQDKHRATMLMQDTMLIPPWDQANPPKQHVLQEPTIPTLVLRVLLLVEMLMQDTMFQQQVNPAKLLA